jgi:hypothetical protein
MSNIFAGASYQLVNDDSSPVVHETVEQTQAAAQPEQQSPENTSSTPEQTNQPQVENQTAAPVTQPPVQQEPVDPWASITEQDVVKRFDKKALLKALELDEFAIDAVEYYQSTGDLAPYAEVKTVDWAKVPDEDIMRKHLREEYASLNLTDEDFDRLFNARVADHFKINPEVHSESEVATGRLLLKVEAQKHRQQFIERQQKFKAPERQQAPVQEPVDPAVQLEQAKQNILAVPAVKEFVAAKKLTLGQGDQAYNYEVNPDEILGALYDGSQFARLTSVTDAQGNLIPDYNKLIKVAAFLKDPEAFERTLINHGKTLGEKALADELENPSNNTSRGTSAIEPQNIWQAAKQSGYRYN